MNFLKLSVIFCVVLMSNMTYAQYKNDPTIKGPKDTIRVSVTNVNDELIPWIVIPEVAIVDTRLFKSPEEKAARTAKNTGQNLSQQQSIIPMME